MDHLETHCEAFGFLGTEFGYRCSSLQRRGYAVSLFVRTYFTYLYDQRMISHVDFHVSIDYERCGSAAALFPGLRVRIPPGAWLSVSCECCVLSGRGLCVGPITRPEESYRVLFV